MILSELNFFSEVLGMRSTMHILLPQQAASQQQAGRKRGYRTLYLLHGHSDDHTAWLRWSAIEKHVEGLNLAVVMPAVDVSFYTDMVYGKNYFQFISQEIPSIVQNVFPLSRKREANFVAGLSMGGYGAFKLALTFPERYVAAASLSGAVDIGTHLRRHGRAVDQTRTNEFKNIFGDVSKVPNGKHDLFWLAKKTAKATVKPRLYQCCGTEDFLYADNIRFRDALRSLSLDHTYEEGPGEHTWAYWDCMIQNALAWMLPAGKHLQGLVGV